MASLLTFTINKPLSRDFINPSTPPYSYSCSLVIVRAQRVFRSLPLHDNCWFSPLSLLGLPLSNRGGLFQCNVLQATHVNYSQETSLLSFFLEMGITKKATEILLDNHPAIKMASLQSVRNLTNGLQDLGINGPLLVRLINKRPDVLISSKVSSLVDFLSHDLNLKGMIEGAQVARLLIAVDPQLLPAFQANVCLLLDLGIPRGRLAHVLNSVNLTKALCLKSSEEIERMVTFLNEFGGVELIIRRPAILNFDLDSQLIPRIEFLLNLSGGDKAATTTVLRKLPFILAYTVDHYTDHVEFLRSFAGLTDEEIFKIILVYPSLFSASRKRKLHPRIHFLKQCGLNSSDIFKFLIKAPLFLSLSFEENLAFKMVLLLKIGYEHRTKELALAMGAVTRTSCKNMQEVVSLFLNYGLTCEDILAMGKKHPQVLQYNHESLKVKLDYLIEEMGREVRELLAFPAFLGYEFDGRIKHRFEAKGKTMGEGMSINKLLSVSTERFSMKKQKRQKVKKPKAGKS